MQKLAKQLLVLLCILSLATPAWATDFLVPVGVCIGLELTDDTVTVAQLDEILGQQARQAGVQPGDRILQIDATPVRSAEDVRRALNRSGGTIRMRLGRNGKCFEVTLQPHITTDGPKIGVFLKQGVTGLGTVTWYDPQTGAFAALGHGVNGSDGKLLQMTGGRAFAAQVVSVQRGESGKPGQLRGAVEASQTLGQLQRNTGRGVFGKTDTAWQGQALPVAKAEEVRPGPVSVWSTVSDEGVRQYAAEIVKVYPQTRSRDKNMLIRITDPQLLETTGGIVQGMSGSPIIQDGKLVGAVTHVLVNDPTTGYGIFIENMLDAAA